MSISRTNASLQMFETFTDNFVNDSAAAYATLQSLIVLVCCHYQSTLISSTLCLIKNIRDIYGCHSDLRLLDVANFWQDCFHKSRQLKAGVLSHLVCLMFLNTLQNWKRENCIFSSLLTNTRHVKIITWSHTVGVHCM